MTVKNSEVSVKAANKNMRIFLDDDGIYKHIEQVNPNPNPIPILAQVPPQYPIPEGGYTNEFLYHSICSMEHRLNTRMDNLSISILNELRNFHHDQREDVGEDMD